MSFEDLTPEQLEAVAGGGEWYECETFMHDIAPRKNPPRLLKRTARTTAETFRYISNTCSFLVLH